MLAATSTIVFIYSFSVTTAMTFDWIDIQPKSGDTETIVDHSQLQISSFVSDEETIHYVNGPFTFKKDIDDSCKIHYILQYNNEQSQNYGAVFDGTVSVHEFITGFFLRYMLPMTRHHNDFSFQGHIKRGTYHIWPVQDRSQLSAPSELDPAEYKVEITYRKDGKSIGGFAGRFVAKTDKS